MTQTNKLTEWESILSTLTAKEAKVIIARFGLFDRDAQTLEQVGQTLDVTRERIRQIESKALRKLRAKANLLGAKRDDYLD